MGAQGFTELSENLAGRVKSIVLLEELQRYRKGGDGWIYKYIFQENDMNGG